MKISFKSMAAAAVLAVASLPSLAQVTVPSQPAPGPVPGPGTGSGGLTVVAYDAVRGVSISQYLGLTMDQFLPAAANAITSPLDFGTLGGWSTVFGASDSANITWALFAGDTVVNTGAPVAGRRLMTTATAPNASNSVGANNAAVAASLTTVNDFWNRLVGTSCNNGLTNPCNALTTDDPHYAGRLGNQLNDIIGGGARLPFTNTAAVGSAMSFWLLSTTTAPQGAAAVGRYENGLGLGQWLLSAAGELTYSLPAVPLPAGVWLLLSGLAGAAAVGRRKQAQAAA